MAALCNFLCGSGVVAVGYVHTCWTVSWRCWSCSYNIGIDENLLHHARSQESDSEQDVGDNKDIASLASLVKSTYMYAYVYEVFLIVFDKMENVILTT